MMAFTWTSYNSGNPISLDTFFDVATLLGQTAKVHRQRDLANVAWNDIILLVNTDQTQTPGAPSNPARNWMKIDHGINDNHFGNTFDNNGDIVIVYRLMQHRGRLAHVGRIQWSVTVGFDQRLLPAPPIAPAPAPQPYLDLAVIFARQIRSTLASMGQNPTEFIMIDDDKNAYPPPNQRQSKIGLLVDEARLHHNDRNYPDLRSTWTHKRENIPSSSHGERHKGYKSGDNFIWVTTVNYI